METTPTPRQPAPTYLHGHCMRALPDGHVCRAPATIHLLVDAQRGIGTFACPEHEEVAIRRNRPIDRHDVAAGCIARVTRWVFATPSFCEDPEDQGVTATAAEESVREDQAAGELIGAGQR